MPFNFLKYPPWLKEKKSTLKSEVYENYSQQYKLVCEICSEYDKESEQDSDETKKERFEKLMRLMQQVSMLITRHNTDCQWWI